MIMAALSKVKDNLSSYVKRAAKEEVVITSHGRPVGVLKGFADEDEYIEYRLLHDARFQRMIERSRNEYGKGKVTRIEDLG